MLMIRLSRRDLSKSGRIAFETQRERTFMEALQLGSERTWPERAAKHLSGTGQPIRSRLLAQPRLTRRPAATSHRSFPPRAPLRP
jgi:hypothetical protein